MRHDKQVRVYKLFESNAKKVYPYKTMYQITKELNNILEEMLYNGKKRKRN